MSVNVVHSYQPTGFTSKLRKVYDSLTLSLKWASAYQASFAELSHKSERQLAEIGINRFDISKSAYDTANNKVHI